jgi:hypothetical protein
VATRLHYLSINLPTVLFLIFNTIQYATIVLFYTTTLNAFRGPRRSSRSDGWYISRWRVIRSTIVAIAETVVLILHICGSAPCKLLLILLLLVASLALPLKKQVHSLCRAAYFWRSLSANSPHSRKKESSLVEATMMLHTLVLEAAVNEVEAAQNMVRVRAIKASPAPNRLALIQALNSECGVVNAFYNYARALLDLAQLLERPLAQMEQGGVTTILLRFISILKSQTLSHVKDFMQSNEEITWSQFQVTMSNSMGVLDTSAVLVEHFRIEFAQSITSNLGELSIVLEQYRSTLGLIIGELSGPPLSDCSWTTASEIDLPPIDPHRSS